MSEQLTVITPGSQAKSSVLNDNFNYLNERITELGQRLTTVEGTLNTNINTKVSSLDSRLTTSEEKISAVETTANSALTKANNATKNAYITSISGTSNAGYIVYSNKYCEQWGITNTITGTNTSGRTVTVNLSKSFANENYTVETGALYVSGGGSANDDSVWVIEKDVKKITFFASHQGHEDPPRLKIMWRAKGFIK